jgi:hypothetical protein
MAPAERVGPGKVGPVLVVGMRGGSRVCCWASAATAMTPRSRAIAAARIRAVRLMGLLLLGLPRAVRAVIAW